MFPASVNVFKQCVLSFGRPLPPKTSPSPPLGSLWSQFVQVVMLAVWRGGAPVNGGYHFFKIEPLIFCIRYLNIHTPQHSQVYNH